GGRARSRRTSPASSSMQPPPPPSSVAHTTRARAACRPNRETFPDSDKPAPTRTRRLARPSASTGSLSHLLFVPELVPVGRNDGVLHLHGKVIGVEDGPRHADHR